MKIAMNLRDDTGMFREFWPFWATLLFAMALVALVVLGVTSTTPEPLDVCSLTPGETVIIHKVSEADF